MNEKEYKKKIKELKTKVKELEKSLESESKYCNKYMQENIVLQKTVSIKNDYIKNLHVLEGKTLLTLYPPNSVE